MYLPIGLFGVSIATATLPAVSRQRAQQDTRGSARHDRRRPVADADAERAGDGRPDGAGEPIVRVMFERGEFTPADTLATAAALQFYAIGLVGYSVVRIASPTFYALGRNRTPVIVSIVTVLVNAVLNVVLVRSRWATAGWRSARRSRRCSTPALLLVLLRGALGGLNERTAARLARADRGRVGADGRARRSCVDRAARPVLPGDGFAAADRAGSASTSARRSSSSPARAWLLRIREFNDGVGARCIAAHDRRTRECRA